MKVVKIRKSYRNGENIKYLVLNDSVKESSIEYLVESWCEKDPSGLNYGYSYKYEIVEDRKTIEMVLSKELEEINLKISKLNNKSKEIKDYLYS